MEEIGLRPFQRLALIQRQIGAVHEFDGIAGPCLPGRNPDRPAHVDHVLADRHRGVEHGGDLLRRRGNLGLVGRGKQHCKFVTAKARAQCRGGSVPRQPVRHRPQQYVAGAMTEPVVHRLEPVEVHHDDRGVEPLAGGALRLAQPGQEGAPVSQAGQLIVERQMRHVALSLDRRRMRAHDVNELLVLPPHPAEQQDRDDRQVRRCSDQQGVAGGEHRDHHRHRARPDHRIGGARQRHHAGGAGDRRQRGEKGDEGGHLRAAPMKHPCAPSRQRQAEQQRGPHRRGEHPPRLHRARVDGVTPFVDAGRAETGEQERGDVGDWRIIVRRRDERQEGDVDQ